MTSTIVINVWNKHVRGGVLDSWFFFPWLSELRKALFEYLLRKKPVSFRKSSLFFFLGELIEHWRSHPPNVDVKTVTEKYGCPEKFSDCRFNKSAAISSSQYRLLRKKIVMENNYSVHLWTSGHICSDFSYSMFTIQSIGEERQTEGTTLLSLDSGSRKILCKSKCYLSAYIPIWT